MVVGYSGFYVAARWVNGIPESLPDPNGVASAAYNVNGDGSVVNGQTSCCGADQAARWTAGTDWVSLGTLPGTNSSQSFDTDTSGNVIVGAACSAPPALGKAFRWTSTTGISDLGFLPGGNTAAAFGVSGDGNVVVGQGNDGTGARLGFRWTSGTGMVSLGNLPGGSDSSGWRANIDGSVIVGSARDSTGQQIAVKWTAATGWQSIKDLLVAAGVSTVNSWHLDSARGASDDGTIIAGVGIKPFGSFQGWRASFPLPFTKDDCKGAGWANFTTAPGPFRNQGHCVSYFAKDRHEDLE